MRCPPDPPPGAGRMGHRTCACRCARRTHGDALRRDASHAAHITSARENPRLPGIKLAADIVVTNDIAAACRADIILIATPAQHLRGAVNAIAPHLKARTPVIACAKGIEHGTHKFMTEIIAESRAACGAGDPVGPELCRRCREGLADGGDAGGKGRDDRQRTGAGAGLGDLPALSHHGRARRRDRRRRQERAGDRGRHRGRAKARRLRAGRADHARLLRARAVRPRAWRAQRKPWSGSPASAI